MKAHPRRDARQVEWEALRQAIIGCEACPRLRAHCTAVARTKRRQYRDEPYWGRPVPGFGDPDARLLVVGLAPAAHGANRTGRMFTGDASGDWLYEALHRIGLATAPTSRRRDDGLRLSGAYITASVRCAPPGNRPTTGERANCRPFLERELDLLPNLQVIVCLGHVAFETVTRLLAERGHATRGLEFRHGAVHRPGAGTPVIVASYHPSRQNTQTGRLTRVMWHEVFDRVRELLAAR